MKRNESTKQCSKKAVEEELQTWFSNARDRGAGGRKSKENRRPLADLVQNDNWLYLLFHAVFCTSAQDANSCDTFISLHNVMSWIVLTCVC